MENIFRIFCETFSCFYEAKFIKLTMSYLLIIPQIFYIYISCYFMLKSIDKYISHVSQNLCLRIGLSITATIAIYNTYENNNKKFDPTIVQKCGWIFFFALRLNYLLLYPDKLTRQTKTLSQFIFEFLWLLFPINKLDDKYKLKLSIINIFRLIITTMFILTLMYQ
eukprot:85370_1